jgi:hypothetical protein
VNYLYGYGWNDLPDYRRPIRPYTEARARKVFEAGGQLTIAAGPDLVEGDIPRYTLTIRREVQHVGVTTYTPGGSIERVLVYSGDVKGARPGQLFLTEVVPYEYPDQDTYHGVTDHVGPMSYYEPTGYARLRVAGKEPGVQPADQVDTLYEFRRLDLSTHWVPDLTTWGDWDRLGLLEPDYVRLDPDKAAKVRRV